MADLFMYRDIINETVNKVGTSARYIKKIQNERQIIMSVKSERIEKGILFI